MLRTITSGFSQEDWTKIVERFEDLSLIQTWAYAEAKAGSDPWEVRRTIFMKDDEIVGAAQQLVRQTPILRGGLAWINRGPLWRTTKTADVSVLLDILQAVRTECVDRAQFYLRVAPPVSDTEIASDIIRMRGFSQADATLGWASAKLDLSVSVETLRSALDKKWRNALSKAERLGLTLETGGAETFRRVVDQYKGTLSEKKFSTNVTPEFLVDLQDLLSEERKLWAGIAWQDRKMLGGVLLARYGNTAEYLVGTTTQEGRASNASHFLLWQGICEMKELGFKFFDVGGMDDRLTSPGILHFKRGMSGKPYRLIGEFEAHDGRLPNRLVRWRVNRARGAGV